MGIILLKGEEYVSGALIFMDGQNQSQSNPFPDSLVLAYQIKRTPRISVISTFLGGISAEEAFGGEKMPGKEMDISININTFKVISFKDILAVNFTGTSCDNPQCAHCVKMREAGERNPYLFTMTTHNSEEIRFKIDTFEECAELAEQIMKVSLEARFPKKEETPTITPGSLKRKKSGPAKSKAK